MGQSKAGHRLFCPMRLQADHPPDAFFLRRRSRVAVSRFVVFVRFRGFWVRGALCIGPLDVPTRHIIFCPVEALVSLDAPIPA